MTLYQIEKNFTAIDIKPNKLIRRVTKYLCAADVFNVFFIVNVLLLLVPHRVHTRILLISGLKWAQSLGTLKKNKLDLIYFKNKSG